MQRIVITVPEFCQLLGISRSLAFELMRAGEVTRVKLGRKTVILRTSVDAMIERNSSSGPGGR